MRRRGVLESTVFGVACSLAIAIAGCAADSGGGGRDSGPMMSQVDTGPPPMPDAGMRPVRCGDRYCDESAETCRTCPFDCNECPMCPLAPGCSAASGVPTGSQRLEAFDNMNRQIVEVGTGEYADDPSCLMPELRLRVRRIFVEDDARGGLFGGGSANIFCTVSATDGTNSELFVSDLVLDLNDGDERVFSPTDAIFWGQTALRPTQNNLSITYQCFETDAQTFSRILDGISNNAIEAGGSAGIAGAGYGWAFGAAGIVAGVLAEAFRDNTPDPWLSVTQTINRRAFYEMTNGRIWRIDGRIKGRMYLEIESWGCADAIDDWG